jgi:hypothetical protein
MADTSSVVTRPPLLDNVNFPAFVEAPSNVNVSQLDGSPLEEASSLFSGISVWKYILIILVIAFLGFNIFAVLGDATTATNNILYPILNPILSILGYSVGETVKQTTNIAAKGVKFGANVVTNTVDSAVDIMEKSIESNDVKFNRVDNDNPFIVNSKSKKIFPAPEPDDATSSTQRNQKGKSGYCYIGEDRGFRSCIKMEDNDKCMSGNIFPSEEICLNPALRE